MVHHTSQVKSIVKSFNIFGYNETNLNYSDNIISTIPDWINQGPLYGIFVRSFSERGDLSSVEKKLDQLSDLGIKTIWLLPFYPIGQKDRKDSLGSPYAIKNFKKIDPGTGNENDLKMLVNEVHKRDMRIIIDFVANHAAIDFEFPELLDKQNPRRHQNWTDVYDFNIEFEQTREYLIDSALFWIKEFDIDGYRCDSAGLLPDKFWINLISEVKNIKPDVFFLAEWENPDLMLNGFHATYDWTFYYLLKKIIEADEPASSLIEWIIEKQDTYPVNSLFLRFLENHDLPRLRQIFNEPCINPLTVLLFVLPGVPLIQAGQEYGIVENQSLFKNDKINWEKGDIEYFNFCKYLIHIRKKYCFYKTKVTLVNEKQNENLLIFSIKTNKDFIVILNMQNKRAQLDLNTGISSGKKFKDILNPVIELTSDDQKIFTVDAFAYHIFKEES